jgi:hypothetical protein
LWNIPPLQPCANLEALIEPILLRQTPVWNFAHPRKGGYDEISIPSTTWPQDANRPIYFSLSATDLSEHSIAYYMMKSTGNQQDDGIPTLIPLLMASAVTDGFVGGDRDLHGDMRVCDDWLIQPWVEDPSVVVNITRIPTTRREDTPNKTFQLWRSYHPWHEIQCYDLCPTSGRLCCSLKDDGYEIRVMDYIVPR